MAPRAHPLAAATVTVQLLLLLAAFQFLSLVTGTLDAYLLLTAFPMRVVELVAELTVLTTNGFLGVVYHALPARTWLAFLLVSLGIFAAQVAWVIISFLLFSPRPIKRGKRQAISPRARLRRRNISIASPPESPKSQQDRLDAVLADRFSTSKPSPSPPSSPLRVKLPLGKSVRRRLDFNPPPATSTYFVPEPSDIETVWYRRFGGKPMLSVETRNEYLAPGPRSDDSVPSLVSSTGSHTSSDGSDYPLPCSPLSLSPQAKPSESLLPDLDIDELVLSFDKLTAHTVPATTETRDSGWLAGSDIKIRTGLEPSTPDKTISSAIRHFFTASLSPETEPLALALPSPSSETILDLNTVVQDAAMLSPPSTILLPTSAASSSLSPQAKPFSPSVSILSPLAEPFASVYFGSVSSPAPVFKAPLTPIGSPIVPGSTSTTPLSAVASPFIPAASLQALVDFVSEKPAVSAPGKGGSS